MNKSISKSAKIIWFVVLSLVILTISILVYYYQKGTLSLKADIKDIALPTGCTTDIVSATNFNDDTKDGWITYREGDASSNEDMTSEVVTEEGEKYLKISTPNSGSKGNYLQFYKAGFNINNGCLYRLTFDAKADKEIKLSDTDMALGGIVLMQPQDPWAPYYTNASSQNPTFSTEWSTYDVYFKADRNTDNARITHYLGKVMGDDNSFYIDNISLSGTNFWPLVYNENQIVNSNFNSEKLGQLGWTVYSEGDAVISKEDPSAEDYVTTDPQQGEVLKINVENSGSKGNYIQLFNENLIIEKGQYYSLTFKAKADREFNFSDSGMTLGGIELMGTSPPWPVYYASAYDVNPTITTEWRDYEIFYQASTDSIDARLTFYLGKAMGEDNAFYFDDVTFSAISESDIIVFDIGDLFFAVPDGSTTLGDSSATNVDSQQQSQATGSIYKGGTLASTGANIWVNIIVALALIIGIGYLFFRKEIHG